MQRASELFNEQQRKQVEDAVSKAESGTSCEIVPVVATESGRYDRPEDMAGLWLAIIAAVTVWLLFPRELNQPGDWAAAPLWTGLTSMIAAIVVAFVIGTLAGNRIGWLRRLCTPRKQMLHEVGARAREIFFDRRVHHTLGNTGMLIYVSLFEHMAVVLGDQEVLDKLGQPVLDHLCEQLTSDLRQSHPSVALSRVITSAGEELSGPLPRSDDDQNELQDALVLID